MSMNSFDQRDGYIWYNGKIVEWKEAQLHVLNHGLHYASAVFEGERVYEGRVFKLREHTDRLHFSAEQMGFALPYSSDEIEGATQELIKLNQITDGYVRPFAWRGSEMMAVSAQHNTIHVAIACWAWPSYFTPEARMKGIRLDMAKWRRPSPETAPVHAKASGLYMIGTLSKHAAEAKGFDDALMLDYRGYISESTGANIFLVQDGEIHTPIPDCFLDGITRRTVMKLAQDMGYKIVERHILPEEFTKTTEVFLCGTAVEVTPVREISGQMFTPGEISQRLITAYDQLVRKPVQQAASAA